MIFRVLGAAAGGGFPQWNCNCPNCAGLRAGTLRATARTQSSLAVSTNGERWLLVNASPDIHRQLAATLPLRATDPIRTSRIAAVLLVDGQIDHAAGLLLLREHRAPLEVWTTAPVHEDLTTSMPLLRLLDHYCGVSWHEIPIDGQRLTMRALTGLSITALVVPGKPGPYSPHRLSPRPGDNIAVVFEDTASGRRLVYAPGVAAITPPLAAALGAADVVLVDGTCYHDDDLIRLGVSTKSARDMGHLPQAGPEGMLAGLAALPPTVRKILIHINNTNPILDEASAERRTLEEASVEVAFDGMEIVL